MYTAKYKITEINSEDKKKIKSCLEAKFNFGQEVAPRDKAKVEDRIRGSQSGIDKYLESKNFLKTEFAFPDQTYKSEVENKRIIIGENIFKLGFNFYMDVSEEVLRKDMFDLDALNHFILTGKVK